MSIALPHLFFLIGLACYLLVRAKFQRPISTQEKVEKRSSKGDKALVILVVIGQVALPLIFMTTSLLEWASYRSPPLATWVGAIVFVTGLCLFWKSHADLGRNWSVSLDLYREHKLVTSGVYRVIRHPMYASFFAMAIAQGFLLSNWVAGWSALAATILLYIVRKPNEEALMIKGFGEEYRRYMLRSGGILPRFIPKNDA
ncbi:protein-S-isoprenylcysteine O-methyltransferase [Acidovorax sp. SDU_ACID1]|uniref:protein-S-isoprenylcysteine O-methyltransferase n=1 Tax=Acidovorax sp. SDU_ACID1 TaxID=3136632 RepID=UPI00387392EC